MGAGLREAGGLLFGPSEPKDGWSGVRGFGDGRGFGRGRAVEADDGKTADNDSLPGYWIRLCVGRVDKVVTLNWSFGWVRLMPVA